MTKERQDIKVNEGRPNEDLYDRLNDDMVNSRVTCQKRLDSTAAVSGGYFQREAICSLAEERSLGDGRELQEVKLVLLLALAVGS